jgi:hypothetical protein
MRVSPGFFQKKSKEMRVRSGRVERKRSVYLIAPGPGDKPSNRHLGKLTNLFPPIQFIYLAGRHEFFFFSDLGMQRSCRDPEEVHSL